MATCTCWNRHTICCNGSGFFLSSLFKICSSLFKKSNLFKAQFSAIKRTNTKCSVQSVCPFHIYEFSFVLWENTNKLSLKELVKWADLTITFQEKGEHWLTNFYKYFSFFPNVCFKSDFNFLGTNVKSFPRQLAFLITIAMSVLL